MSGPYAQISRESRGFELAKNDVSAQFYTNFLNAIGAPVTALNIQWLKNWHAQENSDAKNNPFDTTLVETGSTPMDNNPSGNNGHPVQNYLSEAQGLEANASTLKNPRYAAIIAGLKANDQTAASDALVNSAWGTHTIKNPETGQKISGVQGAGSKGLLYTGGTNYQPLIPLSVTSKVPTSLPSWLRGLPPNFLVRGGEIIAGGVLMLVGVISVAYTLGGKDVTDLAKTVVNASNPVAAITKSVKPGKPTLSGTAPKPAA
jgi:hypothetical protein